MFRRRLRKRRVPGISIAPLIDCVFLLLIFFVVTSTMSRDISSMRIELPRAAAGQDAPAAGIKVEIPLEGGPLVNGRGVKEDGVGAAVARLAAGDAAVPVSIFTDRRVPVERVVAVMDQVRLAGLKGLSLITTTGGRR